MGCDLDIYSYIWLYNGYNLDEDLLGIFNCNIFQLIKITLHKF